MAKKKASKKKATRKKSAKKVAASGADSSSPVGGRIAERRFELVEGKAAKFWTVRLNGDRIVTTYGRLDSTGQSTEKRYDDRTKLTRRTKNWFNRNWARAITKSKQLPGNRKLSANEKERNTSRSSRHFSMTPMMSLATQSMETGSPNGVTLAANSFTSSWLWKTRT